MSQDKHSIENPPKVISMFGSRKVESKDGDENTQTSSEDSTKLESKDASSSKESAFLQEMRRNMENAERLRKERLKANQGVLKSYRIKN
jgi:hypothetical protein